MQAVERDVDRLRRQIEQDPDEHRMLKLAEQMKEDHSTIQEALDHARIPEKDKRKLRQLSRQI